MKKVLELFLLVILLVSLIVLTGCDNKDVDKEEVAAKNTVEDTVVSNDVDNSNSKLKNEEDIVYQIKVATQKYFEGVYGEKVIDARFKNIKVYKDSDVAGLVDLAENDYAFEIDYEIKPADEKYVEELTDYLGKYDEESGWIFIEKGFGVMRYNTISGEYDVTSITLSE